MLEMPGRIYGWFEHLWTTLFHRVIGLCVAIEYKGIGADLKPTVIKRLLPEQLPISIPRQNNLLDIRLSKGFVVCPCWDKKISKGLEWFGREFLM